MKTTMAVDALSRLAVVCACGISLGPAVSLAAHLQESNLRAERTVEYQTGKAAELRVRVGPIIIESVEFSDLGRGFGAGGIAGRIRGGGSASEASTTIRSHFLAQNPSADEWEVTFTMEFLDRSGKLIDRVTKRASWEGEAKPYDLDHPMLEYVIASIAEVRIKLEGRLD